MGSLGIGEVAQSQDQWGISKDAFAPPPTRRVLRGWDRAPVEAHIPRLQGMKVWKKVGLKENESEEETDEVLLELEKDGAGARKKARVEGTKQNIGEAGWGNMEILTDGFVNDKLGAILNGLPSESPAKRPSASLRHDETTSTLQFVPRKRTNNNHVITPKKPMRQTTLDRHTKRTSMAGTPKDLVPRSSKPRKSLRKSFRRNTLVSLPIEESMFRDIKPSMAVEKTNDEDSKSALVTESGVAIVEQPTDRRTSLRRSIRGTRASTLSLGDLPATKVSISQSIDEPTEEPTTTEEIPEAEPSATDAAMGVSTVPALPSKEQNLNATTKVVESPVAVEIAYIDEPAKKVTAQVIDSPVVIKDVSGVTPKRWRPSDFVKNLSANAAAEFPCESSPIQDINIPNSASETPRHPTIHDLLSASSPTIAPPTLISPARQAEAPGVPPVLPIISERVEVTSLTPAAEADIAEIHAEIPTIEVTDVPSTLPECEVASPERTVENSEVAPEISGDAFTEIVDQTTAPSSLASCAYDHDDTDMLRNFLTRVKANKAAKKSPKRKRSLPHSPLRIPLGDVDNNFSPSPLHPKGEFDLGEMSPIKAGNRHMADTADGGEPPSCRRSGRTRIPSKAPLGAPSFIPVRRLGQDPDTTVTLKRTEEKELAALTRINTRKNKGTALSAAAVLAKKAEEKEDPMLRQRLLKEVFDEKTAKGKAAKEKGNGKGKGKMVAWAEQLARFQEADKGVSDKETEREGVPAEKKKAAVRVGVRSKIALGMATNGTPAPKRRMRGHV